MNDSSFFENHYNLKNFDPICILTTNYEIYSRDENIRTLLKSPYSIIILVTLLLMLQRSKNYHLA